MNYYELQLVARNTPGCLERILNTSRVRGFEIKHFNAKLHPRHNHFKIELAVASNRSQQHLVMQLAKQYDIRELSPAKRKFAAIKA
ncbi:acetolactate synthase 2 small subunit [Spartinivicinus poritis]|uniref:Acetolactate synthase 2 small subunit n=1 Tax=Spartinivicinus poritis TaxID=2994640 RepID=A0ABT5UD89_9GAMM|nr:acetolactate synthase 2 small subunit [Spartinivicinus sp. A2-2]MDE1464343.1 acetolactate synthase 2 small subunit [Spartinivicinus sp. A2-2]